jgi:hypothetical protein
MLYVRKQIQMPEHFKTIVAVLITFASAGCYSDQHYVDYIASQRQSIVDSFPLHSTSRSRVHEKYGTPTFTYIRPAGGWKMHTEEAVQFFLPRAEIRSGKKIEVADRYYGLDGYSRCSRWLYFSQKRLVEADWQLSGD